MISFRLFFSCMISCFLFSFCQQYEDNETLNDDELREITPILLDMFYAEAASQQINPYQRDSVRNIYEQQVLKRYDMTLEDYKKLREKYISDPRIAYFIFESMQSDVDSMHYKDR